MKDQKSNNRVSSFFENLKTSKKEAYVAPAESENIDNQISTERERLKNKALEQDISLKKTTLNRLFVFLGLETLVVFIFALFQAIEFYGFKLEEWSFRLLLTATILQITYMLQVAVKHLFPEKEKEEKTSK